MRFEILQRLSKTFFQNDWRQAACVNCVFMNAFVQFFAWFSRCLQKLLLQVLSSSVHVYANLKCLIIWGELFIDGKVKCFDCMKSKQLHVFVKIESCSNEIKGVQKARLIKMQLND